jgi:2,3-bisphosphoglycerate-dependent phosphoglycerate mutase
VLELEFGKNIVIAAHGNSLRAIIMYLDKLTPKEVIEVELSTGIPMLYTLKDAEFLRRGSPIGPTVQGIYALTPVGQNHLWITNLILSRTHVPFSF